LEPPFHKLPFERQAAIRVKLFAEPMNQVGFPLPFVIFRAIFSVLDPLAVSSIIHPVAMVDQGPVILIVIPEAMSVPLFAAPVIHDSDAIFIVINPDTISLAIDPVPIIPHYAVFVEILAFAALLAVAPGPGIHFSAILVVVDTPAMAFSAHKVTSVFNGIVFIILDPTSEILVICPLTIISEEAVWYDLFGFGRVIGCTPDRVETTFAVSLV
jgi:hypothetical protein